MHGRKDLGSRRRSGRSPDAFERLAEGRHTGLIQKLAGHLQKAKNQQSKSRFFHHALCERASLFTTGGFVHIDAEEHFQQAMFIRLSKAAA